MRGVCVGLGFAGLVLSVVPAEGAQCGFERCWGAVAIGPTGEWSWSTGYVAESGAVARIRNECPSCSEIETFYNGCGAMASADDGAWGFGWAMSPKGAERAAISYCEGYGKECRKVVWACSY